MRRLKTLTVSGSAPAPTMVPATPIGITPWNRNWNATGARRTATGIGNGTAMRSVAVGTTRAHRGHTGFEKLRKQPCKRGRHQLLGVGLLLSLPTVEIKRRGGCKTH